MVLRVLLMIVLLLAFTCNIDFDVTAQSVERIGESINTSSSSLITNALRDRLGQSRPSRPVNTSIVKFKPVGDSGVIKALKE